MTPGPGSTPLVMTPADRATLERWSRMRTAPQRTVLRCRIVLMLGDGVSAREVARRLGVSRQTVDLWRKRYLEEGPYTLLHDRPGRGRPASSEPSECAVASEHPSGAERSRRAVRLPRGRGRRERRAGSK
jgi:transposase-like protein